MTTPADKDASVVAQTASAGPEVSDEPLRKIVPREVAGRAITGYANEVLPWEYNHDVVCMSNSDMEDHVNEVIDLQKKLSDLQSKVCPCVHRPHLLSSFLPTTRPPCDCLLIPPHTHHHPTLVHIRDPKPGIPPQ